MKENVRGCSWLVCRWLKGWNGTLAVSVFKTFHSLVFILSQAFGLQSCSLELICKTKIWTSRFKCYAILHNTFVHIFPEFSNERPACIFRVIIIIFNYALQPSRLIVRSGLDVSSFATRRLHACHHARAPSDWRLNCGREMSENFA